MRKLAFAAALVTATTAISLGTMTSAMAERSIHDLYPIQHSSEVRNGARLADRQACNDFFADVTNPSCAVTSSANRPAWRGLN